MADEQVDFDRYIPQHVRENYEALVAERHGGDWSKLARAFDNDGEQLLARWAASHGDGGEKAERAVDKAPKTTRKA